MLEEKIVSLTEAIHRLCDTLGASAVNAAHPPVVVEQAEVAPAEPKAKGKKGKAAAEAPAPAAPAETPAPAAPAAPTLTMDDMRRMLGDMSAKYGPECVVDGLARLGCAKLSEVQAKDYEKLLAEVKKNAEGGADPLA